ncbi:phosphoadenosine phosphosulfate reductase family protein [Ktedonobacter racemifer]|uniref:Phosphoadenosine phosphosulfate reductase n=1 Tax=Ktedonobacter racemifer DSM 44963 TaxID=485913 RepID=D6TKY3_KTERA|nr:phosphoadenosine phosphosulfate reductase family protein [Ktedonobacter racemifer]EFH86433.1 phosphoadenosine phosphosulfate reductase [Ktedonobacter racemifer DSM 44963]
MNLPDLHQATRVVVSVSGGKDSIAMLLEVLETVPHELVIAHHQIVLEDWPGTVEYCGTVCRRLGVPLYCTQASYSGYECLECHHRYLVSCATLSIPWCRACGSRQAKYLRQVESVLDLVEWRQAWPSLSVRFCTSYFKRDNFNSWARANAHMLGDHPVICLGERALESRGRAKLPMWRERSGLKQGWMHEWRPVLSWRRIEVFQKMQAYQVEPHYCYDLQGMTEQDMYETDIEGGPRMSCVMCFLKSPEQLRTGYYTQEGRAVMERALAIEAKTGHTIQHGHALAEMLA